MPVTRIQSPDGQTLEFPDGMSMDEIRGVMKTKFPPNAPQAAKVELTNAEPPSKTEKFLTGMGDIGLGGVQAAVHLAPSFDPTNPKTQQMGDEAAQAIDQHITDREGQFQQRRKNAGEDGVEWARNFGRMTAAAPVAALLPESGPGIASTLANGAVQGGALAALEPVTDAKGDYGRRKTDQVLEGAGFGSLGNAVTGAAGRMVAPNVDPNVKYLMDRGVTPTPGQTLGKSAATAEEKLSSIPLLGDAIKSGQRRAIDDYNKAAYNEVLQPLKMTYDGPIGHDAVKNVGDAIGKQYDTLLPKLNFKVDQQFATELQNINQLAQNLTPEARAQYNKIVKSELASRLGTTGTMDGQTFKEAESVLGNYAKRFNGSQNANDQLVGDALNEVISSLRAGLDRANPNYIGELSNINEAYGRLTIIERAAAKSAKNEGVFTPEAFMNAVTQNDSRIRKRGVGRGEANMQEFANAGNQVLGKSYPDSGTAGRTLAGLAGAGGLSMVSPLAAGAAGTGMLAYTKTGQQLVNGLLARRPKIARPTADAMNKYLAPALSAGLIFGNGGQ